MLFIGCLIVGALVGAAGLALLMLARDRECAGCRWDGSCPRQQGCPDRVDELRVWRVE